MQNLALRNEQTFDEYFPISHIFLIFTYLEKHNM